ncbi:butyrate kinase [Clostridiaceae bacterium UIB06]|uniref:Probable butyrate kinase n=1 Tax=Clostridium thailandense TaxID=2794346 RepID=A0A949TT98_9CLOT|nr:butyrate kinase [Clostridium thailandense]MBV7272966.1 butyrate kinase [Clostridium thailandense]MCH5136223.1 butyrate kinase [Clostridiaceae bacterium UIB06]
MINLDKTYKILVINPGSTSTKIAIYNNEKEIFLDTVRHSIEDLEEYETVYGQYEFRKKVILEKLNERTSDLKDIAAVVGRGGNMKPVVGGTYRVNDQMIEDLKDGVMGQHASNLGGILAAEIATMLQVPAFVVDPVVVDEFHDLSRISGIPDIQRKSKDHPLNQKAAGRKAAEELGGEYNKFNFLIVHLGGGISVGIHKKGRIIDVNNSLDGDGPFSPERGGGLPVGSLIDLCYSGKYTKEELRKMIVGRGGLVGYLGTNDTRKVSRRAKLGDKKAELVYKAMAYQVAKEIGAGAAVLKGEVDAIILTGGIAFDELFVNWIREYVDFIGKVIVYPGEFEMLALAQGVLRVFNKKEDIQIYK